MLTGPLKIKLSMEHKYKKSYYFIIIIIIINCYFLFFLKGNKLKRDHSKGEIISRVDKINNENKDN